MMFHDDMPEFPPVIRFPYSLTGVPICRKKQ